MPVQLYFRPMACSLASRIALYEAGVEDAIFTYVDKGMAATAQGEDFLRVNPMAQVPALRLESGEILTENAVVLQYIADQHPDANLAPAAGSMERYRMMTWLNFVTTELHTGVFHILFDRASNDGAKAFAYQMAPVRLARLEFHLTGREWLVDSYSVADIYLYAVLNWAQATEIKLSSYPALTAFMKRMKERPAVSRAFGEEAVLYRQEQALAA